MKTEIVNLLLKELHDLFTDAIKKGANVFGIALSMDHKHVMWYDMPQEKHNPVNVPEKISRSSIVRFITILGMISECWEIQGVGWTPTYTDNNRWSIYFRIDVPKDELLDSLNNLFIRIQETFRFLSTRPNDRTV